MQQRISTGKGNLSLYMFFAAETVQIIENPFGLIQRELGSVAAIVAMPAMQVAGLGDVPLQCKCRGCQILPAVAGG